MGFHKPVFFTSFGRNSFVLTIGSSTVKVTRELFNTALKSVSIILLLLARY